jgi:hypothetical protein
MDLYIHSPIRLRDNFTLLTYLCTELSPSWEAANCAAIQEIASYFKEPEGSSPWSQEPSTGPHLEPVPSTPHHPIPLRFILILSTHLRLGLPSGLFPFGFPTNIIYQLYLKQRKYLRMFIAFYRNFGIKFGLSALQRNLDLTFCIAMWNLRTSSVFALGQRKPQKFI